MNRIELSTPCLQGRCSPSWATPPYFFHITVCCSLASRLSRLQPDTLLTTWTFFLHTLVFCWVALTFLFLRYYWRGSRLYCVLRSVFVSFAIRPNSFELLVGSSGLEPPTSRLSGGRSNHLSYEPIFLSHYRMLFSRKLLIRPSAWCASHDFSFFSALCSYLGWIFLSLTRFLLVF